MASAYKISDRVIAELRQMIVDGQEQGGVLMGMARSLACPQCQPKKSPGRVEIRLMSAKVGRDEAGKPLAVVHCEMCGFQAAEPIPMADA